MWRDLWLKLRNKLRNPNETCLAVGWEREIPSEISSRWCWAAGGLLAFRWINGLACRVHNSGREVRFPGKFPVPGTVRDAFPGPGFWFPGFQIQKSKSQIFWSKTNSGITVAVMWTLVAVCLYCYWMATELGVSNIDYITSQIWIYMVHKLYHNQICNFLKYRSKPNCGWTVNIAVIWSVLILGVNFPFKYISCI